MACMQSLYWSEGHDYPSTNFLEQSQIIGTVIIQVLVWGRRHPCMGTLSGRVPHISQPIPSLRLVYLSHIDIHHRHYSLHQHIKLGDQIWYFWVVAAMFHSKGWILIWNITSGDQEDSMLDSQIVNHKSGWRRAWIPCGLSYSRYLILRSLWTMQKSWFS